MRLVVHALHLPHGQLRIPLRRRQPLMPQHLLDRTQIRTLLQHVRAKRMPQSMRMHIRRQPATNRNLLHNPPHTASRQPASPSHRRRCRSTAHPAQARPYPPPSTAQPAPADTPESPLPRHRPTALTFPCSPYQTPESRHRPTTRSSHPAQPAPHSESHTHTTTQRSPDPAQAKPPPRPHLPSAHLRAPFSALSVSFSPLPSFRSTQRIQHPVHLLHTRHPRQMLRQLRRTHQRRRIRLDQPLLRHPLKPTPNRRQRARHARLVQPPVIQHAQVRADVQMLNTPYIGTLAQIFSQKQTKIPNLTPIRPQRMLTRPTLIPQRREKALAKSG